MNLFQIGLVVFVLVVGLWYIWRPIRGAVLVVTPALPTPPPKCANCKHFDSEEGQAAIQQFPHFMKAAAVIPPSLMGAKAELVEVRNEETGEMEKVWKKTRNKGVPARATWDDLGACMRPNADGKHLLVYNFDKCEHYEVKDV